MVGMRYFQGLTYVGSYASSAASFSLAFFVSLAEHFTLLRPGWSYEVLVVPCNLSVAEDGAKGGTVAAVWFCCVWS